MAELLKVKFAPFDKKTDEMLANVADVSDEVEIEWRPNKIFYDKLKILEAPPGRKSDSKRLYALSLTTGTLYRLMSRCIRELLTVCKIDNGVVEGYWRYTRESSGWYGIKRVKPDRAPKRLQERVLKEKLREQIRSGEGREIRIES